MDKHLPVQSDLADKLKAIGFVSADQVKDFGMVITGLIYLRRAHNNQFQYVWLCHYEGRFLEAGFQAYFKEFNSRAPKGIHKRRELELGGYAPMFGLIYRDEGELFQALDKTYEPTPADKPSPTNKNVVGRA